MRKLLAIAMAAIMSVSVLSVAVVPAMAAVSSPAPIIIDDDAEPELEVNGQTTTTDITYSPDENDHTIITFVYTGDGELIGWEDNLKNLGLTEGTDYTAVMNPDKSYTIHLMSNEAIQDWNDGKVIVNAIVEFPEPQPTTKKDGSSKSPKTGADTAIVAGAVALAGAGFAVLGATKKKDAE